MVSVEQLKYEWTQGYERRKIENRQLKKSHSEDNILKKKEEIAMVEKKDNSMENIKTPTDYIKYITRLQPSVKQSLCFFNIFMSIKNV